MKNSPSVLTQDQRTETLLLLDNVAAMPQAIQTIEEAGGRITHQFERLLIAQLPSREQSFLRTFCW